MLTVFHDYTSPASAVAVLRLQRLAADGLAVAFEGIEALGVDASLPVGVDVLAGVEELAAAAAAQGLQLRRPRVTPPTALAHVVGEVAEAAGLGDGWRRACYGAYWTDGADLADPSELADVAQAAGVDRAAVLAALADRSRVVDLRRRAVAHRRQGVGGVPTILVSRTLVPGLLPDEDLRALAAL